MIPGGHIVSKPKTKDEWGKTVDQDSCGNDIGFGHPSNICIKTPEVIPKQAGAAGAQRGMFAECLLAQY